MNATFAKMPARAASANLRGTDWAVLHAIALHVDKKGRAFPSMERIATITGINRSNVPRALDRLERRGLLRRRRVRKGAGGWQVNNYELIFDPLPGVIMSDDTASADVITSDNRCHHRRGHGVITNDALTDHLTDQSTDSLPEGRVSVEGTRMQEVLAERLSSAKPNGSVVYGAGLPR
jgi:hypothetical protein